MQTDYVRAGGLMAEMTRAEHLAWAKQRAFELIDKGDLREAFLSMVSDLGKHDSTRDHSAITLGMSLLENHLLDKPQEMWKFIDGFN